MGIFKNIGNKIKSGFNKFGNKLSSGITKGKQFWNKHGDTIASIGNGALRAAALYPCAEFHARRLTTAEKIPTRM